MCGIAGFCGLRQENASAVNASLAALRPRGPDAEHATLWNDHNEPTETGATRGLLHTRLSIRDPRPIADQPMSNSERNVWLVYNGEIYSWEQDAMLLRQQGYHFASNSDTEFVLNAYLAWGEACVERFRGMFAIAIFDQRRNKLLLVRDRFGIKPLVYYVRGGELAFASTVRGVLPLVPRQQRQLAAQGIDAYLAHRYIPAPLTVYQHVRRLPAAHMATFDLGSGSFSIRRYWTPQPRSDDLGDALREAITTRTVADRPVGLFLSGGIDSSTVASALVSGGFKHIAAYTAAFPGSKFDESPLAARIAESLGMTHHILPVREGLTDDFEKIVADLDEPFADPSAFPLWYLAREATRHVKVVLSGDGGDELFGGYKRYRKHLRSAWRRRLRLPAIKRRSAHFPARADKILDELGMTWQQAYSLRFSGMAPSLRRFLQPELSRLPHVYWQSPEPHASNNLNALIEIDLLNYLPEYILRKGDLCTMSHGLEQREPLLDHRLYEVVLGMPREARFSDPPKHALAAVCKVCQSLDLFNQPKRGFNPPIDDWLKGPLKGYIDNVDSQLDQLTGGQLSRHRIRVLLDRYFDGDRSFSERILQLAILAVSLEQLRNYG